jgi:hypothetical protein
MEYEYKSRYGKIIKSCPGLPEYWYRGKLIARGSSISSPNPASKPTPDDWAYCVSLRPKHQEEVKQ